MAAKAKAAGKADVPNLQESVVEVHVHGGTKRKAELPPQPGKGKDVKKIRAALLGTASGAGSASGEKFPEAGLIELPEISVRKDISIDLPDIVVNSIDNMEVDHIVRTMVEFGSKALVLSRCVGSLILKTKITQLYFILKIIKNYHYISLIYRRKNMKIYKWK